MSLIDELPKYIGLAAIVVLLIYFLRIDPSIFKEVLLPQVEGYRFIEGATRFLWGPRFIDTLAQGIIVLAGLLGVLIYVLWGERE